CAVIHRQPDHAKAVAELHSALALAAGNEDDIFELIALYRMEKDEAEALGKDLRAWMEKKPARTADVLISLAKLASAWAETKPKNTAAVLAILDAAGDP